MNAFDRISDRYREKSLVQQKAALKLIGLLDIGSSDDIIDIGCGPGHITNMLSNMTQGRVTGIDISEGMIKQAKEMYPGIEFRQIAAEDMDYSCEFDIVFCNSALQWFTDPERAVKAIFHSLDKSGKLCLACPATYDWTPWMSKIISTVGEKEDIKPVFSHWKNPWFQLASKEEYRRFFEKQGFKTNYIELEHETTPYSIEEAFGVYLSGAANGYTGKKYYDIEIDDDYVDSFNNYVKEEINKGSKGGKMIVDFNRLYYIGKK